MEKLDGESIIKHLNWRYATKKFDPTKKISSSDWHILEETLRLAPSSFGLQPWRFIVVDSPEVRKKLTPASWGQSQIENCSHLVVVTHLKTMDEKYIEDYIQAISKTRGVASADLKGYKDQMVGAVVHGPLKAVLGSWVSRQAYIAMGAFMTVAALLHIDVCPMEGIEPAKYDEILNLNSSPYTSVAVLATGYRAADDHHQHYKKVRFDKKDVIKHI